VQNEEMSELLVRLSPKTVHLICDELSISQIAMRSLINDKSVPDHIRDKLELLTDRLVHIAGIGRQFLFITDNRRLTLSAVDVRQMLAQIEPMLLRLLGDEIQLRMIFGGDLWPMNADCDGLIQIFCGLSANARDAMPSGGTVCIRVSNLTKAECEQMPTAVPNPSDYVLVEFEDTGRGIPDPVVGQIFDPFFTTKGAGSGFGLASVYNTAKQMNGHIAVDSRVGCGTTFSILLPRHTV
jgi:two-component system, cell cycle sensor histidine kinase and response regulator CckA